MNRHGIIELGNYTQITISKDFSCKVLNPRDILLHIIKHRKFASTWLIKDFLFLGGQGSGKSTFINYLLDIITAVKLYRQHGILIIKTNDVRILSDKRYNDLFKNIKIVILILDDIMSEGFDSRRASSSINVGMTQFYNKSRHALKEKWKANKNEFSKNGILFVFFANQVRSRVDPTIRENVMVKIFTSYVDKSWFHREFKGAKQIRQMEILRQATFEGDLGDKYTSKAVNVIKLKTGHLSACKIPRFYNKQERIEYSNDEKMIEMINNRQNIHFYEIYRDLGKEDFIQLLIEKLRNKFRSLNDIDRGIMIAYLQKEADKLKEEHSLNYTKSDIIRVIDTARMIEYEKITKLKKRISNLAKNGEKEGWDDEDIMILHDTFKFSYATIEEVTGISHSTAHRIYIKAKNRFAEKINALALERKDKLNVPLEIKERA